MSYGCALLNSRCDSGRVDQVIGFNYFGGWAAGRMMSRRVGDGWRRGDGSSLIGRRAAVPMPWAHTVTSTQFTSNTNRFAPAANWTGSPRPSTTRDHPG